MEKYTDAFLIGIMMAMSKQLVDMGVTKKYIPVINLFFGVGFSLAFNLEKGLQGALLYGLAYGLGANGTYDLTKILKAGK